MNNGGKSSKSSSKSGSQHLTMTEIQMRIDQAIVRDIETLFSMSPSGSAKQLKKRAKTGRAFEPALRFAEEDQP